MRSSWEGCFRYCQGFGWFLFYRCEKSGIMRSVTSRVYAWPELIMSMMTSILNLAGLILSEWTLASFIIILRGLVLSKLKRTNGFCVILKHRHSSRRHFRCRTVQCIPCRGLPQNGSLTCCIRCSWFFVMRSLEGIWIFYNLITYFGLLRHLWTKN